MYFEWSDGTPVTYTKWLRGEPTHANNRQEDCVVMKGKVKSCRYWLNYLTTSFIVWVFFLCKSTNVGDITVWSSLTGVTFFEVGSLFNVARKLFLFSSLRSRQVVVFLEGKCPSRSTFLYFRLCTWAFLKKLWIQLWSKWICKKLFFRKLQRHFGYVWIFSALSDDGLYIYLKIFTSNF